MERKTLILSEPEVRQCVDLDDVFRILEETFREAGKGQAILPPKLIMNIPAEGHADYLIAGPASVPPMKATGVKVITGFKDNPKKHGLPYILSTMLVTEHETGYPLAIFDATHLTNSRTGGMVALAAKYLARKDSAVLALVGAGTQARAATKALSRIFALKEVRVFDVMPQASQKYQEEMTSLLKASIRPCALAREAIEGADIIVTVTSAEGEFVKNDWVKPGAFIASVGTYQELDATLPHKVNKVVVDDRNQARYRGELWKGYQKGEITDALVYADLGEVVCGKKPGRENPGERNLVCITGIGTPDVTVGKYIYEKAVKLKLGTPIKLF
jgi:alanine dehydrogenase